MALLVAVTLPLVRWLVASGAGVPYTAGDLFIAVGDGRIEHYDARGNLVDSLDAAQLGEGGGLAFDGAGNLLAANFTASAVSRFDNTGNLQGTFGGGYNFHPEAIVRDRAGNVYVGLNDGDRSLLKFSPEGTLLQALTPVVENRGIDWADLDADQCTLFYTSEGKQVRRFNVCNGSQLPDFATLPIDGVNTTDPTSSAYGLRIRHNGEVLVATAGAVYRLGPDGGVLDTYTFPGSGQLLTMTLDPDLTAFWTGDYRTGRVLKVDIESGGTLLSIAPATSQARVSGVAVFGEFLRAIPQLRLSAPGSAVTGQPAQVTASVLNVPSPEGTSVTFTVTGANAQEATVPVDASGNAVFTFVGATEGTDTVVASVTTGPLAGTLTSNTVTVVRGPVPPTALVYSGATSGTVGRPATMAARLTYAADNQPLSGQSISLGFAGGERCTATTDATGVATCSVTPSGSAGPRTVTAEFAGSPTAGPSTASAEFALATTPAAVLPTALVYTGPASAIQGEPVTLSARLVDSTTGLPIGGVPVNFVLNATESCGATTTIGGVASCRVVPSEAAGNYPVTVTAAGDGGRAPASTTGQLLVVVSAGPVMGGRATVVSLQSSLLGNITVSDTGDILETGASRNATNVLSIPGPILSGGVADAVVATEVGASDARSSLTNLTINLLGPGSELLAIKLGLVEATATSGCGLVPAASSRIGFLSIGPVVLVNQELTVPPNSNLTVPSLGVLPRIAVTLNEQRVDNTSSGSELTVNAVHITVAGLADIVVSSARSFTHRCAGAPGVS